MNVIDYTISSIDYEHNNRIYTNITSPSTEFCKMTITSLTTIANFVLLDKSDFITINEHKYYINEDYSDVNTASLVELLNGLINVQKPSLDVDIAVYYDSCSRIYFTSLSPITINECSYNLKLMLGLVNVELPIKSNHMHDLHQMLLCPDVGLYLSTPVLYLACNLGSNSYKNMGTSSNSSYTSNRILMRLTNSFFARQPICNPNGDYTTTIKSSDLSDVRFTLIDANYHEVKLLSPMYLTVQIEPIPDAEDKQYNIPTNVQTQLQTMSEYAYMHDLTERGMSYDLETIGNYIYFDPPQQQENQQENAQNTNVDTTS